MLQEGAGVTAAVRVAPAAGEGRLADGLVALAEQRGARHQPWEDAEHVVGTQRIGAFGHPVEQHAGAQPIATEILAVHCVGEMFRCCLAFRQVHVEHFAVEGLVSAAVTCRHEGCPFPTFSHILI